MICATEVFGSCPPKRGQAYPRRMVIVLPKLAKQKSMPNPCAGVPDNPWCTKQSPITGSILPLPLLGLALPPRRVRAAKFMDL